jgi:hypothetical protein
MRFLKSHPGTATVLVDEFDAGDVIAASSWAVIRRPSSGVTSAGTPEDF